MRRKRIDGTARKAVGAFRQAVGRATGNRRLEARGAAEKAYGSAQNGIGKALDFLDLKIGGRAAR